MNLYKTLAKLGCFNFQELVNIVGSKNTASWYIQSYLQKGYIKRIKRDLYVVISLENDYAIPNRFQIASHASNDSYISHHSAFEYYGCANQVFYDVYFSTKNRIKSFSYDGLDFCPIISLGEIGVIETNNGIRITSIERTVIDSIASFNKIAGLEELLRCLLLIPNLDSNNLLESLEMYNRSQLYQKVGYILESFKEDLCLPEDFFNKCESKISSSKTYLFEKEDDFVYFERWKLYAPKELKSIINKGVFEYNVI